MKKIIIIGAGVSGLSTALLLDKNKYDVSLYEQKNIKDLGYSWCDDVNKHELNKINFKYINFNVAKKEKWRVICSSDNMIEFSPSEQEVVPCDRKDLFYDLYNNLKNELKVEFGTKVNINEMIKLNPDALIIDCSGINLNTIPNNGLFHTYRGIFKCNSDNFDYERNIYLKPNNSKGISWCNLSKNKIDVLIGQIGLLEKNTQIDILSSLKTIYNFNDNDLISSGMYQIPVKNPEMILINQNYVKVGDNACMTAPVVGSGIVNSIKAAKILTDLINNEKFIDTKILWEYQKLFFKEIGTINARLDVFKKWLLECSDDNLTYLIENQVITPKDLENIMSLKFIDEDLMSLLSKGVKLSLKPKLALEMGKTFLQSIKIKNHLSNIPDNYDFQKIIKWAYEGNKIYK